MVACQNRQLVGGVEGIKIVLEKCLYARGRGQPVALELDLLREFVESVANL